MNSTSSSSPAFIPTIKTRGSKSKKLPSEPEVVVRDTEVVTADIVPRKRFKFDTRLDILLLKEVLEKAKSIGSVRDLGIHAKHDTKHWTDIRDRFAGAAKISTTVVSVHACKMQFIRLTNFFQDKKLDKLFAVGDSIQVWEEKNQLLTELSQLDEQTELQPTPERENIPREPERLAPPPNEIVPTAGPSISSRREKRKRADRDRLLEEYVREKRARFEQDKLESDARIELERQQLELSKKEREARIEFEYRQLDFKWKSERNRHKEHMMLLKLLKESEDA